MEMVRNRNHTRTHRHTCVYSVERTINHVIFPQWGPRTYGYLGILGAVKFCIFFFTSYFTPFSDFWNYKFFVLLGISKRKIQKWNKLAPKNIQNISVYKIYALCNKKYAYFTLQSIYSLNGQKEEERKKCKQMKTNQQKHTTKLIALGLHSHAKVSITIGKWKFTYYW